MDFVRGMLLFVMVAIVAAANAQLGTSQKAFLLWSRVSDDQWSRQCTYYEPFRIFKHEIPVGST